MTEILTLVLTTVFVFIIQQILLSIMNRWKEGRGKTSKNKKTKKEVIKNDKKKI